MELLPGSWERMVRAVRLVAERLHRSTEALAAANIPYAVIGGNAAAYWVATVDEAAVRNTPDVNLLVNRADLERVKLALSAAGFPHRELDGRHVFVDGEDGNPRSGVWLTFAGEKIRPEHEAPAPTVEESEAGERFRVLRLEPLVRMKLTWYRTQDRVHLRDLIDVGRVDFTWPARFPPQLAQRLQALLDDPDG